MKDYTLQLLNEINAYDGDAFKADHIRQLICYISDNKEIEKTDDVKEILFEASQLIRVFGYNWLNKYKNDEVNRENELSVLKNGVINKTFQAKSDMGAMLDKKQKEIIDYYQKMNKKRVFVSAPTSFGKTHILKEIIFNNINEYNNIVLIFPTVALLSENMDSITEFVEAKKLDYKVSTTFYETGEGSRNIFILTPERAIVIFEENPKIKIDFFFFDEVYKIDEDFNNADEFEENADSLQSREMLPYSRAVAFRLVLYFLAMNTKDFYFAGPYIKIDKLSFGMKCFLEKFDIKSYEVTSEATLKTYIKSWNKKNSSSHNMICEESHVNFVGKFDTKLNKVSTILNFIKTNSMGQTLVYCNTPAKTISLALPNIEEQSLKSEKLQNFINHLKNRYSVTTNNGIDSTNKWSLIKLIEGEIGIHHGKLPKYMQKEILNFFNKGELKTLFCTSTLIEGVNTNAKNIVVASSFIRNSDKLNQFDLKNIIGRAGRYYHHFMGNVFFLDKEQEEILKSEGQSLNFPIFDDVSLSAEDIDNIDIAMLGQKNIETKKRREGLFDINILPNRIFYKNRLFDRYKQQNLMMRMVENYARYKGYLGESYNVDKVLDENFITLFLQDLCSSEIITEKQMIANKCIIKNYKNNGIKGLLEYEFNYSKKHEINTIDKGYENAFSKVKTIIEYSLPRYFILLQSLLNYLAEIKNEDFQVDFCNIIRYFEIGIKSTVGAYLVDKGMPPVTMRSIEDKFKYSGIVSFSMEEGLMLLSKNKALLYKMLDAYELSIINKFV